MVMNLGVRHLWNITASIKVTYQKKHMTYLLTDDDFTCTIAFFFTPHLPDICKGITQTLIPDTSAVKPKASQSTDGNLLWSVVYISDTVCLRAGVTDDLLTS
jgi:hypothetical protein